MSNYFIGIIIFLLSGFIGIMFAKKVKLTILIILNCIASIFCLIPAIKVLLNGQTITYTYIFNNFFGPVSFIIDNLSAFFISVISIMSIASIVYAKGYLKPYIESGKNINSHIVFLPMLTASMLSVVTCQNVLMFLICWEIMSLSSFFLVIFENEKKEVLKAGLKYLVFMHISVLFIILAFTIVSISSGSFDFQTFINAMKNNEHLTNTVFILAFIGFGTKAGLVPFHNWLPDAHPAAPSHVSAIMSGIMIKTGIYGILRMLTFIDRPSLFISYFVLIISVISALYGVLYAITQHDIKRLLAYHSIENIGIIGIGIGVGMLGMAYHNPIVALLGFAGGILHILNHSVFKELLFLAAGSVYQKTHTKNIELLGGLIKSMPITTIMFLVGSIAICGLPPFNGFISEFLVYLGMFKGLSIHHFICLTTLLFAIAGLALVGTMAILCFTKAFSIIFLGAPRSNAAENVQNDTEKTMLIPMGFLASLSLLIGIFPHYIFMFIIKPVNAIIKTTPNISKEPIELMQLISIYALIFIIVLILSILLKLKLTKNKISVFETWGCGYNRLNNHMQYTASSYASPFLTMLKPLFKNILDIEKPRKLFPKTAHFSSHVDDIEEAYIIEPLIKTDEWILSKFEALQSGNIQSYIKLGLGFLILVIIGSLFIG